MVIQRILYSKKKVSEIKPYSNTSAWPNKISLYSLTCIYGNSSTVVICVLYSMFSLVRVNNSDTIWHVLCFFIWVPSTIATRNGMAAVYCLVNIIYDNGSSNWLRLICVYSPDLLVFLHHSTTQITK